MSWLTKLTKYAPIIGATIASGGATLPGLALDAIGNALGVKVTSREDAELAMSQATPEQLHKLKAEDNRFKVRMAELTNQLAGKEIKDIQHARDSHKHSMFPAVLCSVLTLGLFVIVAALMHGPMPTEAYTDTIKQVIASYNTAWIGSVAYWFGTTRSSAQKSINAKVN